LHHCLQYCIITCLYPAETKAGNLLHAFPVILVILFAVF
jgi:hypothetical protein